MNLTEQLKALGAQPGDLAVFKDQVGLVECLGDDGYYALFFWAEPPDKPKFFYSHMELSCGPLMSVIRPPPELWKPETWEKHEVSLWYWIIGLGGATYSFQKLVAPAPAEEEYTEIKVRVKKGQRIRIEDE